MLNNYMARGLMNIIPDRRPAVVRLYRGNNGTETVNVSSAWKKPLTSRIKEFSHLSLQGNERLIKIPDHELNPNGDGREIRGGDEIDIDGVTYVVIPRGAILKAVLTNWSCACEKKIPSA